MRKIIFALLAVSYSYVSFCQGLPNFDAIPLSGKADYKTAEPYALQASTFLLSTPAEKDNLDRLKSLQFIIKWMSGTPDYMFSIDDVATKIMKGDDDMLGLYMAAMTKFVLENNEAATDQQKIKLNAVTMLLDYCENPANKIKMSKNMRKLSEAKANGQLEEALR